MICAPLALANGSFIFLAFIAIGLFGVVWAYYTKAGSDIAQRPSDGLGDDAESAAPGAEGESTITGKVDGEQDRFTTHGTE